MKLVSLSDQTFLEELEYRVSWLVCGSQPNLDIWLGVPVKFLTMAPNFIRYKFSGFLHRIQHVSGDWL